MPSPQSRQVWRSGLASSHERRLSMLPNISMRASLSDSHFSGAADRRRRARWRSGERLLGSLMPAVRYGHTLAPSIRRLFFIPCPPLAHPRAIPIRADITSPSTTMMLACMTHPPVLKV